MQDAARQHSCPRPGLRDNGSTSATPAHSKSKSSKFALKLAISPWSRADTSEIAVERSSSSSDRVTHVEETFPKPGRRGKYQSLEPEFESRRQDLGGEAAIALEKDIINVACRTVGKGHVASVSNDVPCIGLIDDFCGKVDRGDRAFRQGLELTFVGNAVRIQVLPDRELGKGCIIGVDQAVLVRDQFRKMQEAVCVPIGGAQELEICRLPARCHSGRKPGIAAVSGGPPQACSANPSTSRSNGLQMLRGSGVRPRRHPDRPRAEKLVERETARRGRGGRGEAASGAGISIGGTKSQRRKQSCYQLLNTREIVLRQCEGWIRDQRTILQRLENSGGKLCFRAGHRPEIATYTVVVQVHVQLRCWLIVEHFSPCFIQVASQPRDCRSVLLRHQPAGERVARNASPAPLCQPESIPESLRPLRGLCLISSENPGDHLLPPYSRTIRLTKSLPLEFSCKDRKAIFKGAHRTLWKDKSQSGRVSVSAATSNALLLL